MLLQTVSRATGSPKNKMAATQTGSTHISDCRQLRNEIPRLEGKIHVLPVWVVAITFLSRLEGKIHVLPVWMVAILDLQIMVSPWSRVTVTISPNLTVRRLSRVQVTLFHGPAHIDI